MKKSPPKRPTKEMRPEYDFSGGVRGKYADKYREGTNVVLLDTELAAIFPDSKSVNDALRALVAIAARTENRDRASLTPAGLESRAYCGFSHRA